MKSLLAFLLLLASPALGQVTFSNVDLTNVDASGGTGGASCNDFSDDFSTDWDTRWTRTGSSSWSYDGTNDVIDTTAGSANRWAIYTTSTATDGDHCAVVKLDTYADHAPDRVGLLLRVPNEAAAGQNVYNVSYNGTADEWQITRSVYNSSSLGQAGTNHTVADSTFAAPSQGDYIAACVSGTSTSTAFEVWNLGSSAPSSNCPADWGTADWSETGCGSTSCVDSSEANVGMFYSDSVTAPTGSGSFDDFAGGDND